MIMNSRNEVKVDTRRSWFKTLFGGILGSRIAKAVPGESAFNLLGYGGSLTREQPFVDKPAPVYRAYTLGMAGVSAYDCKGPRDFRPVEEVLGYQAAQIDKALEAL